MLALYGVFILIFIRPSTMSDEEEDEFEFKFTYWFGMPGTQYDREYHFKVINRVLLYYQWYPEDMDITSALGLVLLESNLANTLKSMKVTNESIPEDDIPEEDFEEVETLLKRTEQLIELFLWYMESALPKNNKFRLLASSFLLNQENWENNLVQFPLDIYTLEYSAELANSWSVPDPMYYWDMVRNQSVITPNNEETEECLWQLTNHVVFYIRIPQKCKVTDECYKAVMNGDDYGYALSQRIFLLIFARFARNCYFNSIFRDKQMIIKLCSLARMENDYLDQIMQYTMPDLMLEFMAYCTLAGHRPIMNERMYRTLDYYYQTDGETTCYVRDWEFPKTPLEDYDLKPSAFELMKGEKEPMGPCDRRLTGIALAAHAAAYRACAQPAYCVASTDMCLVPYTMDEIREAYSINGSFFTVRWYPWKYMVGFDKKKVPEDCGVEVTSNNIFRVFDNDSLWDFYPRPCYTEERDEPIGSMDYED